VTLYVGKPSRPRRTGRRAFLGVLLVLFLWFLVWLAIGLVIRTRMESPTRYIGRSARPPSSAFASLPLYFGETSAPVLDAGHHKQEVG